MEERKLQCESVAEKVNNERASFRDSLVLLCWMGSGEKIPRRDKCYEIGRYFCSRQVSFGDSHHPSHFSSRLLILLSTWLPLDKRMLDGTFR